MSTSLHGGDDRPLEFPRLTPDDVAHLGDFSYHGVVLAIHRQS